MIVKPLIEQCERVIDRLQAQKKYDELAVWQRLYRHLVAYRLGNHPQSPQNYA